MYTSCPECGTVFRITTGDLRVAEGYVRCGHCSAIFNAVLSLSEEMPAELGQGHEQDQQEDEAYTPEVPAGEALPTAEDWLAGAADDETDDGDLPARPEAMADHGTLSPGGAIGGDIGEDINEVINEDMGAGLGEDIGAGQEPGAESDWPLAPAPGGPREPPAEPAEWSTLFDEEDLREVTSRIAVEIRAGDDDAWPEATAVEDEEDGDGSPVYLIDDSSVEPGAAPGADSSASAAASDKAGIDEADDEELAGEAPAAEETDAADSGGQPPAGEEAGAFGPWAWEAPPTPDGDSADGALSPYPPPPAPAGRREPPAPDLWAEEFGDLVIEPDEEGEPGSSRREPRLGEDFGPEPAESQAGDQPPTPQDSPDGATAAASVTAGPAAEDLLPTPRWARDSLVNDDLAPPRDPGEPGALPPLWAPRPGGWDDRAADDAGEQRRRWAFGLGSLALGLLLVLQLIHQQRDDLATGPTLGPVLRQAYGALGFPLMPRWNLAAYEIRGTEAVAGRSQPGSLEVLARIHVVGTEAVGLPLVRVMLRDRFGKPLGSRTLEPAEYLEAGTTVSEPLEPGTSLTVRASLADPGSEAYGYEVDVCLRDRSSGLRCQSEQAPFRP